VRGGDSSSTTSLTEDDRARRVRTRRPSFVVRGIGDDKWWERSRTVRRRAPGVCA
jgi:hypothetical protein